MTTTVNITLDRSQAEYLILALEAYQKVNGHADISRRKVKKVCAEISHQVYDIGEPPKVRVFHLDEYSTYAGYSLGQIIDHRLENESDELHDVFDQVHYTELDDEEIDTMQVRDGEKTFTLRELLNEAIKEHRIPCILASTIE